jgi:hypothetical protein
LSIEVFLTIFLVEVSYNRNSYEHQYNYKEIMGIRLWPLILISLLIIGGASLNPQKTITAQEPETSFLTYNNTNFGVSIDYPSSWEKTEEGIPVGNVRNMTFDNITMSGVVEFLPPDRSVQVIVLTSTLSPNDTLNDFNRTLFQQLPGSEVLESNTTLADAVAKNITLFGTMSINQIKEMLKNPVVKEIFPEELIDAMEIYGIPGLTYKTMNIVTIIGDRIYIIQYIGGMEVPGMPIDQFSLYQPVVKKMIESLKVTE